MAFTSEQQIIDFMNRPGQKKVLLYNVEHVDPFLKKIENAFNAQREHWKKLHTEIFNQDTFKIWVETIPGCASCKHDFKKILETHSPRFDDWQRWSWEVHNIVNAKINKPEISWEEACKIWGWAF